MKKKIFPGSTPTSPPALLGGPFQLPKFVLTVLTLRKTHSRLRETHFKEKRLVLTLSSPVLTLSSPLVLNSCPHRLPHLLGGEEGARSGGEGACGEDGGRRHQGGCPARGARAAACGGMRRHAVACGGRMRRRARKRRQKGEEWRQDGGRTAADGRRQAAGRRQEWGQGGRGAPMSLHGACGGGRARF